MKTSWIIGLVMFYLLIFACEMFATGGISLGETTSSNISNVATENQELFIKPDIQENTVWATITGIGRYLKTFLGIIFLYCPTIFSGYMLWFYWFICFPVAVGFVMSILFIVRGVHSG